MIRRIPLLIANWKANPDAPGRALLLAQKIERMLPASRKAEIVIAPPFPFLPVIGRALKKAKLGAQNVFWEDCGPYTGEVSWCHLRRFGIKYVIVGHSERRIHLGETDEMIAKKMTALLAHGMKPVLCIGERERDEGAIPAIVGEQLRAALSGVKKEWAKNIVIAYEPVWAISTMPDAKPDTPDNAFRATIYIRKILTDRFGRQEAARCRIIYGGSVSPENISSFLREGKMEGALVGGASLKPDVFAEIIRRA